MSTDYTKSTLRPPTDTKDHRPTNDTYIDDLAKWFGRSIALVFLCWLVVWAVGEFV